MSVILNEAFRQLEAMDQDVFDADEEGLKKLDAFLDNDEATDVSVVIDPDAENEDELKDSYIGKILCRCVVCQSDIMKNEEDLHKDENCPDVVNCGDECPMCQSVDGYKIIGRIAPYEPQVKMEEALRESKDVTKGEKSIAAVLNKAENKAKMEAAGSDVEKLKSVVLDILEADELKDNKAIEEAKRILVNAKGFKFLTTLTTYMTGDKIISNKKYDRKGLKEALGTTYDAVLKILDDNGYDVEDAEVKEYANSAAEYIEFSRSQGDMEDYTVEEWFKETKSNYPEDLAELKRVDEAFAANDLAKYQEWVDFDMKKYGRISGITQNKLNKAGLEVVKDDHGDYEVIAKEDDGKVINESVDSVEVKADGQKVEVKQEDDKTTVEVSKECEKCENAETIAPIDKVEENEIEAKLDANEDELDIDEFSEEDFDELSESYLKRVYENVDAYKTTKGSVNGNKIMLEGVITFKSGKKAKTNFVFESANKTKSGKLKFLGENKQFAKNKAFTLTGHKEGKKLFIESFNYKYAIKDTDGKSKQLYGTVKK